MYAITPDIYTSEKLKVKYLDTGTKKQIKIQFNISGIENYIDTKLYQFSLEFSYRIKGQQPSEIQNIYLNNGELIVYVDPVNINKSEFYIFTYIIFRYSSIWTYFNTFIIIFIFIFVIFITYIYTFIFFFY